MGSERRSSAILEGGRLLVTLQRSIALTFLLTLFPAALLADNHVTWGSAHNIQSDSDVSISGTLVYAYAWNGGSNVTVNSVPFKASRNTNGSGDGNGTFNCYSNQVYYPHSNPPFSNLSANYKGIVSGFDNYGGSSNVTLNHLTPGSSYAVQVWINDSYYGGVYSEYISGGGGSPVTLQFQTVNGDGGLGQWAIGTFTASSSTETLTFTSSGCLGISALQVRQTSSGGGNPTGNHKPQYRHQDSRPSV